jgi:hypothetical protein
LSDSKTGPEIHEDREKLEKIINAIFPQHASADAAARAVIDWIKKGDLLLGMQDGSVPPLDSIESGEFLEWMAREYLVQRYNQRPRSRRAFPRIKVG